MNVIANIPDYISLQLSASSEVRLVIDAEYTYMNPALRLFSVALMLIHNKYTPLVAYTYQNYLKVSFFLFLFHVFGTYYSYTNYSCKRNTEIVTTEPSLKIQHTVTLCLF